MISICSMSNKVTFEERKNLYQEELIKLRDKYGIDIYPANVVMPSGEVMPMIKMADLKEEELKEDAEDLMESASAAQKEDEDKTKK